MSNAHSSSHRSTSESQPKQINLRPIGRLARDIMLRMEPGVSAGAIGQRDLIRYYEALEQALPHFTREESMLLVDALNGHVFHHTTDIQLVWAIVDDAIRDGHLDQKWEVNRPALVERLRGLSYMEKLALVDAIERAWNSSTYTIPNMEGRLSQIGLFLPESQLPEQQP